MAIQETHTSFRLISIEPLNELELQVRDLAEEYGLDLQSSHPTTQNAPFCGYDLFCQDMTLSESGQGLESLKECFDAIEALANEATADGYLKLT